MFFSSPPGAAYGTTNQIKPFNPHIVATCNEIQSFPLFLTQPWSVMLFSPRCLTEGFSEVIPVTVVPSFLCRLVITVVTGKSTGHVSRASGAEQAPEIKQSLQHKGSKPRTQRAGHQQLKLQSRFPALGPCKLSFLTAEPCISVTFVALI